MNKLLQRVVFYFLIISFCTLAYSQNQEEKQPIAKILLQLEKRYNVKFSFEPNTLKDIKISPLYPELSLEQALKQLTLVTQLNFEILSKRFIAITPKKDKEFNENIQRLDEVIVTNYLTKGIAKTSNGTIEVDAKSFNILPGLIEPDVLQIVQNLPGILSVDERISNINVRGGTNDQNLILYEGIRMYQSGHFFGLISAFNPYLTEEIIVSKNGTSAKLGNGVSSTISIKNTDDINHQFNAGIGGNLLSIDGFAKIPLADKTELQLSARRSFTDIAASVTYDAYFDRIFRDSELNITNDINTLLALDERFLFYDFNAKFLYNINESSKLRVNVLNIYNNLDYNQEFTTSENNFQKTKSALNQISYGASTNYSKLWKDNISTSIEAYYSNYDLDAENNDITNAQRLTQENKVEDYGLRIDISKTISKYLKYNGGYQFNEVGVTNLEDVTNPNFTSLKKEIIRTHALFGEIEWHSPSRDTYIRAGSRISYFGKLAEVIIEPRFNINYRFLDYFRLEVLGELKSQSITQIIDLQQDFFGIEKRRWQLANNNDVPLITSEQISVGLSYNENDLLVSFEGYYKGVNNITARSQGFQNQFQFTNDIGFYTVKGIDFLINKRYNDFSTWLSYSYSKNDYQFEDLNNGKSFANTLDLRHVINTSLTYSLNNLKIGFGINWHSGRPYTKPIELQNNSNSNIEYQSPNSSRLPDYFRTDISAIYNFNLSKGIKAEVGASIWNIFNQTNIINRFYTLDSDDSVIEINNRSLKFTPNFSFRLNF
ncbi:TonB-dependent receptor plug domain-containing protein [Winogradskyella echinorum]|uniref:TonB-dependent receptor plug domain-containing protein n=1 Tax=Winogradskyella echinorum TaxID=538189 RepID=A0ABR6Y5Z0_9FLAO|nr:TonB-dependent receptor [Winogradskyella echinorum]MBC3847683.1 TonB-dependent receptor plug domain-containing protein [Winogradskyella echinorum]MBC5752031.1 TonB-dependent receptor plug domain-containing protein [Winogradskyella echinorum]